MMSPHELVATNLALVRAERGWTQRDLLARLEQDFGLTVEPAALSRKEAAVRKISIDELAVFSAALGVSPCELLLPREPRGDLSLSEEVSVGFSAVRSWVRGHRQLRLNDDDPPGGSVDLPDVEMLRQAEDLQARQRELTATIERIEQRIDSAQQSLHDHDSQPALFEDPHAARFRQGLKTRYEQAVIEHGHAVDQLDQLREQSHKLRKDAVASGWLDQDDAESLLADPRITVNETTTTRLPTIDAESTVHVHNVHPG